MDASPELAFICLALLLAGFIKGAIGLGLQAVAMGLLGIVMSPIAAASLLVVPNLVTNVWQIAAGPGLRALLRRFAPLMVGICAGTVLGTPLLSAHPSGWSKVGLGAALAVYAAVGLSGVSMTVPASRERSASLLAGLATGLITMATGVFVVPVVPYLQALQLEKDELVRALGLSFLVSTIALALVLAILGLFRANVAGGSLLAIAPVLLGLVIGTRVRTVVSPKLFKRCFFLGLLALGAYLALDNLAVVLGQA